MPFYAYDKLETAVRAGARYASLRTYDSSNGTPSSSFLAAVKNMVVYGNPNGGATPVVSGLTADKVALTVNMGASVPQTMAVSINGFQIDAVFGKITWNGKPTAVFRYQGRYAP